jgi:beta-carotene ketolase (CrtW type)
MTGGTRGAAGQRQGVTGLAIAGALIVAWLAIHIAGIFFWTWHATSAPIAVPMVIVQAWLSTGLFIVAHDAMHGSLVPGRPRLNMLAGTACLGLYAALSYRQLRPKHGAHHRHSGSAADPDFHAGEPCRVLPWFVRFFSGYYTHGQILRITVVALAYIFLLGARLENIVVFWAVPALLALGQLFFFGTYLPHRHGDEAFLDHHNARSSDLSASMSLLTCFNFGGYHHEHHLSPGTPWWLLPRLRTNSAGRTTDIGNG